MHIQQTAISAIDTAAILGKPNQNEREMMMRKMLRASVLLLALSCSVYSGEIPNMVTGDPPPPPPTSNTIATDGEIPNMLTVQAVLESLLSLF